MMRPLKTACALSIEDAFVDFVAGAVRFGVIEDGVIIDVLRAVDNVQAVEGGVRAFGQHGVGVVAHQRAAQRNGMRREIGAAAQLRLQRGNVKGLDDSRWIL